MNVICGRNAENAGKCAGVQLKLTKENRSKWDIAIIYILVPRGMNEPSLILKTYGGGIHSQFPKEED